MSIIEKKQAELNAYQNEKKPSLIVFKGFPRAELVNEPNKFFAISVDATINDLVATRNELLIEVIDKRSQQNNMSWCTFEEYITVTKEIGIGNFYSVIILKNNLYDSLYPYDQTLESVFTSYKELYENDDDELTEMQQQQLNVISDYYGKIYYNELNQKFYVTYVDLDHEIVNEISLFDESTLEQLDFREDPLIDHNTYVFELTDSEDSFLSFTDKVKSAINLKSVCAYFVDGRDHLPHHYDQRLSIINQMLDAKVDIYLSSKKLVNREISNLNDYLNLLTKYWGYESFRLLKMYKDVESSGSNTIEVSQAQIIDDIVEQSSIAMETGKDKTPRDIYVTSPTGAGKSIMFQLPALYLAEKYKDQQFLTIVISPLIGLMDDQVKSLEKKNIKNAKTINSGISPIEKDEIIDRVQNGEIDILYISTETLLSRSDIEMLIGKRKLGLFVIDEAHIVTTWGKSFRADYWYLGSYLTKLRKKQKFPIVTFTATAIYGGPEDMYSETRDSLNMVNPIAYFGYVKRDDLMMYVQSSKRAFEKYSNDYRKAKYELLSKRLRSYIRKGEKTLVYFPTVKLLNGYYSHLKQFEDKLAAKTVRYFGPLDKDEKKGNFEAFLSGEAKIMLATKAFGMGIDIPDITNVYHYAPTGNVIDYIQEIGRAAREPKMIGNAYFDYLNKDFTEVKRLYGISSVKKSEVIEVMKKILDIYYSKKSRNLVVNADDFSYIFDRGNHSDEDIDNRLKITLLTIEKDFEKKMEYSPIVARPRAIFAHEIVFLNERSKELVEKASYKPFFEPLMTLSDNFYTGLYQFDIKALWEKRYNKYSFAKFKHLAFSDPQSLKDEKLLQEIYPALKITIDLKNKDISTAMSEFRQLLNVMEEFLRGQAYSGNFFDEDQFGEFLNDHLHLSNKYRAVGLANVFLNGMVRITTIQNQINNRFITTREDQKLLYKVNPNYINYVNLLNQALKKLYTGQTFAQNTNDEYVFYRPRQADALEFEKYLIILGLSQSFDLISYEITGGDSPQIYIRINSIYPLDKAIHSPQKYDNLIMHDVYLKHKISIAMLNYLFTLPKEPENGTKEEQLENYTLKFWDIIERYFLGQLPEEVKRELYQ
ncbi:DEAD/DEAH box helicase [Sporolactobacillus laevolacticus]|uniref:DEAD/DEAH box helicase n=1 Tax=Sporolactobacillus laevolacticus TaxID=33018 RepID=UPI0025B315F9|nr:DEAD/DEAH box helicase [Sporolactobacillus laevolacticus]MDN3956805.1 helicase-related protein [Sporolactobacillus laevolacticus]